MGRVRDTTSGIFHSTYPDWANRMHTPTEIQFTSMILAHAGWRKNSLQPSVPAGFSEFRSPMQNRARESATARHYPKPRTGAEWAVFSSLTSKHLFDSLEARNGLDHLRQRCRKSKPAHLVPRQRSAAESAGVCVVLDHRHGPKEFEFAKTFHFPSSEIFELTVGVTKNWHWP